VIFLLVYFIRERVIAAHHYIILMGMLPNASSFVEAITCDSENSCYV